MNDYFDEHEEMPTADLRELLGASRSAARSLLAYTDRRKLTAPSGGTSVHVRTGSLR